MMDSVRLPTPPLAIGLPIVAAILLSAPGAIGEEPRQSADVVRKWLQASHVAAIRHGTASKSTIEQAEVRRGSWHWIGPFKDAEYGLFSREFEGALGPERDVIAAGRSTADLTKIYHSVPVVGQEATARRWSARPDWEDGYFHEIPSGPPPSRNEASYLYRTIASRKDISIPAWLVTRDAAKVWLNGQLVTEAPIRHGAGQRFLTVPVTLPLKAGENRLLVKIVSCFQQTGFSFALDGLDPVHPMLRGQPFVHEDRVFSPAYEPFASAARQQRTRLADTTPRPAWYAAKGSWQDTLLATLEAERAVRSAGGRSRDIPYRSRVLRQQDGPQHVRLNVMGMRKLVLVCTIGGDDYGYDDSIWADPRLIGKDGKETLLADLKPSAAQVGFAELFVNRNLTGKPLKIGDREFRTGFWAHAPSVLEFALDGRYEWFDTWFGLDALAVRSGTSEFLVLDKTPAPDAGVLDVDPSILGWLERDFPGRDARHEMDRELADGIWRRVNSHEQLPLLCERYRAAAAKAVQLPLAEAGRLSEGLSLSDLVAWRRVYHAVKRCAEARAKITQMQFDVAPLPSFEPPVLGMQEALEKEVSSPGGEAYLKRLRPLRSLAREALAAYDRGLPNALDKIVEAGAAIDRFREESIRAVGPVIFARRPGLPINAVDPYDTPGAAPARIAVFDPARPEEPPRIIYDAPQGCIFTMSLSFDARTVLFAARRNGIPGGWHIYEIGVDGTGFRQITRGESSEISPIELPSGEIIFVSNRASSFNVCQPNSAGTLYVCQRDGSHVRRVSANTLSDHSPRVMDDGRVMFTRWDYGVDKGVFQRHGVWTVNPDGSGLQFFFGNTILDPNAFWQCVPVPGRPEAIATFGGHHSGPYGAAGLLWGRAGPEAPRGKGFRWLTPELPTYFDGALWFGYMDPYPVNENEFLVSYGGDGGRKNRIYLLDSRGNKTCIWEDEGTLGCFNPMPLRPRPRPPMIPPLANPRDYVYVDPVIAGIAPNDGPKGTLLLADVYQGLSGYVRRGEIKAIQIMELVPKTRPHTGGYAWNISPVIGRGTFYVRRLNGTVPVEEDGSAHFLAPALRDISLNALDAEGRVVQKMGATFQVMDGETRSCIGCHEPRNQAPPRTGRLSLAACKPPSLPERPDWGTGGIIDYVQVVQPVWDKHCVECHGGPKPKGNLDLSGDKTRYFNMSYDMLIDRGWVHHVPQNGADHDLTTPKANGSLASRLRPYLEQEHAGRQPPPRDDRRRVYTWIDANVPYYHTYLYTDGQVNGARDRWYDDVPDGWFQRRFAPVFRRRCYDCHQRKVDISDAWLGRTLVTVTSNVWTDTTLMDQGLQIENSVAPFGPEYRINLTHPQWSQMLTAPLSEKAGGLGLCRDRDGQPIFRNTQDPDYQSMLRALEEGKAILEAHPRVDMLSRPTAADAANYADRLQQPRTNPPAASRP